MAPIQTAEQATYRAEQFLNRYHPFKILMSVRREENTWRLVYNVSLFGQAEMAEITLDADTGEVISYDQVPK
jgi:hypothetical protein